MESLRRCSLIGKSDSILNLEMSKLLIIIKFKKKTELKNVTTIKSLLKGVNVSESTVLFEDKSINVTPHHTTLQS